MRITDARNLFPSIRLRLDAFHFSERRTTLVPFNNLTDQSSRITKKNQFIERIVGLALKRLEPVPHYYSFNIKLIL